MATKRIEDVIEDVLKGDTQKNALDFAGFLRANQITQRDTDGAWCFRDKVVCYMHIDGADEKPGPWTIWPDGEYENFPVGEHIKEIAWANINPCVNCGAVCAPGSSKTVLGKKFDNICNSVMAFTNPDAAALECVKKMVKIRIRES